MAKIGLQLYSVRNLANTDLFGTIRAIADIGYQGIEFDAGMLKRSDPTELKTLMDNLGLKVIGLTVLMPELADLLNPLIDYALETNAEWLVMPWLDNKLRNSAKGYESVAAAINEAAERASQFRLRFAYHLHGYEFDPIDHRRGIDILLEVLDPTLVEIQVDTYWVAAAGIDCAAFTKNHIERIGSFHIKDATSLLPIKNTEVGTGILNLHDSIKLGVENQIKWFIVEQEDSNFPILESIKISQQNLQKIINKIILDK